MTVFELLDVKVWVTGIERLVAKNITMRLRGPSINVVMGPNGAGKSSLMNAVMGHRDYRLEGRVILDGEDITRLPVYEKARKGIALAIQIPVEVEGVRVSTVLTKIVERFWGVKGAEAVKIARDVVKSVGLPESILSRHLMVGLSGGERKRLELARILLQKPKVAILDEPDSGIDVEGIPVIARAIERLRDEGAIVLLVSHQPSLFKYLEPDKVFVMVDGRIVAEGGAELVKIVEREGYNRFIRGGGM